MSWGFKMTRTLRSTSFQFGGFVFVTDDQTLMAKITRLLTLVEMIAVEILAVMWSVKKAANSLDLLCRRLLIWLDCIEELMTMPGLAWRRMVWATCPVWYGPG